MFKYFLLLIAICFVSCTAPRDSQTLVVGLQADYPPYEYVDEQGHLAGFDIEVAQKIADKLGKKLVIQEMGFDALILSLKSHKIDLILSGMSITPDRLKEITMVPYQGGKATDAALLFWKSNGKSIEDLKEKTVAVQSGTFQEQVLREYPEIHPKTLGNTQELIMEIKYGKSDAALVESKVGKEFSHQFPEIQAVILPLPTALQSFGNGIGISKDHAALKQQIEIAVQEMKDSGELTQLERKWFHD